MLKIITFGKKQMGGRQCGEKWQETNMLKASDLTKISKLLV